MLEKLDWQHVILKLQMRMSKLTPLAFQFMHGELDQQVVTLQFQMN